jgi:hypothetical protein
MTLAQVSINFLPASKRILIFWPRRHYTFHHMAGLSALASHLAFHLGLKQMPPSLAGWAEIYTWQMIYTNVSFPADFADNRRVNF